MAIHEAEGAIRAGGGAVLRTADDGPPAGQRRLDIRRCLVLVAATGILVVGAFPLLSEVLTRAGVKTMDLSVFADGARHVLDGQPLFFHHFGRHLAIPLPFIYPPFAALVLTPFTLLSAPVLRWCWELASTGALVAVVAISFRPLKARVGPYWPLVVAVVSVAMLWTQPVVDELGYGQIDLFILLLVLVDLLARPRWCPPGVLIGIAAGIKLVPLIFVLLFVVTLQWRTVRNIVASFAACTLLAFVVVPADSVAYWFHAIEGTALHWRIANFSNQSFDGMLHRLLPGGLWPLAWLPLAALVMVAGLLGARSAERAGERLVAVALIALVGLLLAPISWIHEIVFIVPVLGAIVGSAHERWRVLLAALLATLFSVALALPYRGLRLYAEHGPHLATGLLEDSYGLILTVVVLAGGWWAMARWGERSARAAPCLDSPGYVTSRVGVPPVGAAAMSSGLPSAAARHNSSPTPDVPISKG